MGEASAAPEYPKSLLEQMQQILVFLRSDLGRHGAAPRRPAAHRGGAGQADPAR